MSEIKYILVTRFSAMGDVALTVPVIRGFLKDYPDYQIVFVTRKMFFPFFANIERLNLIAFDPKGKHSGMLGMYRLAKEINLQYKIELMIDLHNVLRTRLLSFFLKKSGVFRLDKGRDEKNLLTRKKDKVRKVLKHMTDRYAEVFGKAGLPSRVLVGPWLIPEPASEEAEKVLGVIKKDKMIFASIGIAPFAKHQAKMWPIEKTRKVIELLSSTKKVKVYLFGAAGSEATILKLIAETHPNVMNLAGVLSFSDEINIMKELKIMMTMDSGNMHLASLAGTRVLSVWGATHPDVGFAPLGDNQSIMMQANEEEVSCRPCSVFGDKPCFRGDYLCMNSVSVESVFKRLCLESGVLL
jgi:ADP-heptose:LPS heptosyltransferase